MIEIVNRQRQKPMNAKRWYSFTEKALEASGKAGHGVTIAFISNRQIQSLNKRFRGINSPTDVLSFPSDNESYEEEMGPSLGEIAISVERAATQANENGLQLDDEIAQLILHGLLHLSGYDHETDDGEMNRLELRLRRRLGIDG